MFPGTVMGPKDPLPFGTEGLLDLGPSWERHKPFRVTAGAQRVSLRATAKGHHTDQGPLGSGSPGLWMPLSPSARPAVLGVV